MGQCGQVVHGIRGRRRQGVEEGGRIGDLDLAVDGDHLVAELSEMIGEPVADEAATAGD